MADKGVSEREEIVMIHVEDGRVRAEGPALDLLMELSITISAIKDCLSKGYGEEMAKGALKAAISEGLDLEIAEKYKEKEVVIRV